jgi:hypothetical protein
MRKKFIVQFVGFYAVLVVGWLVVWYFWPRNGPTPNNHNNNKGIVMGSEVNVSDVCSKLPPVTAPTVGWELPGDVPLLMNAPSANLFGWQEFIALNWKADPNNPGKPSQQVTASSFGEPGDNGAVVWETYKRDDEVFLSNAKKPSDWNAPRAERIIYSISKFQGAPVLDLSEFGQASVGNPWLTAQNGNLTVYEKRMNQDEFTYILNNGLYNAKTQYNVAQTKGIHLPSGAASPPSPNNCYATNSCGSIEIKAAWLPIGPGDNPDDFKKKYKTSMARVFDPTTGKAGQPVLVGLVGLHIIHKTALAQQFIWATFEHVDNTPDDNQLNNLPPGKKYAYYNPNCDPAKDPYQCQKNLLPTYCDPKNQCKSCTPSCPNKNCKPFNAPNQAVRLAPVPSNSTNNVGCLNEAAWAAIKSANPDSVFLNYRLISVLWPGQSQTYTTPMKAPLAQGNPQPQAYKVANTTLETYVQQALSCLDCHTYAPVAPTVATNAPIKISKNASPGSGAKYAADYSFLLREACTKNNGNGCPASKSPCTQE